MAELFIFAVMMGVLLACITFADFAVWAIYRVRGGKMSFLRFAVKRLNL